MYCRYYQRSCFNYCGISYGGKRLRKTSTEQRAMKFPLAVAGLVLLALHRAQGKCIDMMNCKSCHNPDPQCTNCAEGFGLSEDRSECIACPENCGRCKANPGFSDMLCVACSAGKLLDGECKECGIANCAECPTIGDKEVCMRCRDEGVGFVRSEDGDKCIECPGCVTCELDKEGKKAVCTECEANKVLRKGQCKPCDGDNGSKCKVCDSNGVCEKCAATYYLKNGQCLDCPPDCDKCRERGGGYVVCETCSANYGLRPPCGPCPPKCAQCEEEFCLMCVAGAILSEDANGVEGCVNCDPLCSDCDPDTSCTACKPGAALAYGDQSLLRCYALTESCKTFVTDYYEFQVGEGIPQCKECHEGYGRDNNDNTCHSCGVVDGCGKCIVTYGTVFCTTCKAGYVPHVEDDVVHCLACSLVPGCSECFPTSTEHVTCTKCGVGYGLVDYGIGIGCEECGAVDENPIANCASCLLSFDNHTTLDICTECRPGFAALVDDNNGRMLACVSCSGNATGAEPYCTDCSAQGEDTVSCSSCGDYITFDDSDDRMCTNSCGEGCTACEQQLGVIECVSCDFGYRLSDSQCVKCSDACVGCYSGELGVEVCEECAEYHGGVKCEACPANCDECSDRKSCMRCKDGYGLDAFGFCVECEQHCKNCDVNQYYENICQECSPKFQLQEGCERCPENCLKCVYEEGEMVCRRCDAGYMLRGTKCKDCESVTHIKHCVLCEKGPKGGMLCSACADGYTFKDGLRYGKEAECVSTKGLDCTNGEIMDGTVACDEDSCTADTILTEEQLCGRECFVCGDYAKNKFVPMRECKLDDSTPTDLCVSGFCAMRSVMKQDIGYVTAGCLPMEEVCESEEIACEDEGKGKNKMRKCHKCCGTNLCLKTKTPTPAPPPPPRTSLASCSSLNLLLCVLSLISIMVSQWKHLI